MFTISSKPPTIARIQLFLVFLLLGLSNAFLELTRHILFPIRCSRPRRIFIYKIGNLGDITCAIPAFIAIRNRFPEAHITLLTSPGGLGAVGARELLDGARFFDAMLVYTAEDIKTWRCRIRFLRRLRHQRMDLFIQLPDDIAHFPTLLRNLFVARCVGAKAAFGFVMRFVPLWKKTQVDFLSAETEVESLIDILRRHGVGDGTVRFNLPITNADTAKADELLRHINGDTPQRLIAISPGCKRNSNRWPIERFAALTRLIVENHSAKIVIIGGATDRALADIIQSALPPSAVIDTTGRLTILQSAALLARSSLLIANSTGTIHIAAALGIPCLGFYSVRDILGRWFPYGKMHKTLYHRFQQCDYRSEQCLESSIQSITVDEAWNAVNQLLEYEDVQ